MARLLISSKVILCRSPLSCAKTEGTLTVLCEQGTLRCCGRTDKLCVGEILRGDIRVLRQTRRAVNQREDVGTSEETAAPARNQTLCTLVLTNPTATVLVLLSSPEFGIVR